jgi:hypothetical protein
METSPRSALNATDHEANELVAWKPKEIGVLVDAFERHTHAAELDIGKRHDALVSQEPHHVRS